MTDIAITPAFPLRFGHLSKFARAPVHYLQARSVDALLLDRDQPKTSAQEKGSCVHAVTFGTARVVRYPGKVRSGKQWEAFQAEHAGEMILAGAAYEQTMGMAEAVWSDAHAKELLFASGAVHEHTLRPELHGFPCRATPDVRHPDYLADLKTSGTAEPEQFQRHATRMLYHAQLAFYLQACEAAHIKVVRDAYVVAVEATPPHPVVVHRMTERAIDMGERSIRIWVERLRGCLEQSYFPGYVQSIIAWDIEEELELQFAEEPSDTEAA